MKTRALEQRQVAPYDIPRPTTTTEIGTVAVLDIVNLTSTSFRPHTLTELDLAYQIRCK
ncbi:hypothetical protein LTR66_000900, partial [Elasticomyces elasticus]